MLHPYDALDDSAKKRFQIKIIFILLAVTIFSGILIYLTKSILPFIFLFLAINILASFIDVPLGIKKGNLVRYSPMFLTSREQNNKIQLHGGTLFDYYFCLPNYDTSIKRKQAVLLAYLKGLNNLIEAKKKSPETILIGTTYILNSRTAQKIGFDVTTPQINQKIVLGLNYIPITISNSMVDCKLSFPKLGKSIGVKAKIDQLLQQQNHIKQLIKKIEKADL